MKMSTSTLTATCRQRQLRVAVELTGAGSWFDLTADSGESPDTLRIKAVDLRSAQRMAAGVRSDAVHAGRAPLDIAVLVDLDALIADTARDARAAMNQRTALTDRPSRPDTLQYVGTPAGLAGLIGDIFTAGVADGVTVRPLSTTTLSAFMNTTLPSLRRWGLVTDAAGREHLDSLRSPLHATSHLAADRLSSQVTRSA